MSTLTLTVRLYAYGAYVDRKTTRKHIRLYICRSMIGELKRGAKVAMRRDTRTV